MHPLPFACDWKRIGFISTCSKVRILSQGLKAMMPSQRLVSSCISFLATILGGSGGFTYGDILGYRPGDIYI